LYFFNNLLAKLRPHVDSDFLYFFNNLLAKLRAQNYHPQIAGGGFHFRPLTLDSATLNLIPAKLVTKQTFASRSLAKPREANSNPVIVYIYVRQHQQQRLALTPFGRR
jgi:hypothetical protein